MQSVAFSEASKSEQTLGLFHKILNCICIQVASFPIFFNCLMCDAYKSSKVITHLINIFISDLFVSLFNITIPISENNRRTLISTFYNNFFVIYQIVKCTSLFPSKIVVFVWRNFNIHKLFF